MSVVLPLEFSQQFIRSQVSQTLQRPVHIGHIGLGWRGLKLDDVWVESNRPSEEKNLFSIKRVRVYWSLWSLLSGKIKFYALRFEKPTFHLVRYADGSFNIPHFAEEETADISKTDSQEPFKINLHIKNFELTRGEFLFTDQVGQQNLQILDIFLHIKNFQPSQEFPIAWNARVRYAADGIPVQEIKTGFSALLNIHDFDLSQAYINIKQFILNYSDGRLMLNGEIKNLVSPQGKIQLTGMNLSDKLLRSLAKEVPAFRIDKMEIETAFEANLSNKQVDISSFTVQGLDSYITGKGNGSFAQNPVFSAQGNFNLNLQMIGQAVEKLTDYRLKGTLQGNIQATQENFSGEVSAQEAGAVVPGVGNLSDIKFQLNVSDKNHADLKEITGKINDGIFEGNLTAQHTARGIELDVKASAPRIALPSLSDKPADKESAGADAPQEAAEPTNLPPFYIKAAVDINSLDAPFVYGEKIKFRADMQQVTAALDQAQGTLSLSTDKGEIKDLARLTSANILTGVLFGSLDVVGRVINSLNVLSVLNSLGGKNTAGEDRSDDKVVQTIIDENGQEQHILVPYENSSYTDIWKFQSFSTDMQFKNGIGNITKGLFQSDRMSFNLTGDMNFHTSQLDMTLQAAPGLHDTDGVMPLTVTIGGTMENPQGSMKMMSSVASMLTQSVTNNFASRTVKKSVGGVFNLFKKKDNSPESNPSDLPQNVAEE